MRSALAKKKKWKKFKLLSEKKKKLKLRKKGGKGEKIKQIMKKELSFMKSTDEAQTRTPNRWHYTTLLHTHLQKNHLLLLGSYRLSCTLIKRNT